MRYLNILQFILLFISYSSYGQLSKEYLFDEHLNLGNQYNFYKVRYFGTFKIAEDTIQTVYSTYRSGAPRDSIDLHFITYNQEYNIISRRTIKVDLGTDRDKDIGSTFIYWQGLYYFLYEEYRPECIYCKDIKIGCIDDSGRFINSRILIDSTYQSDYQDWKLLYDSASTTLVANINYRDPQFSSWGFTISINFDDVKLLNQDEDLNGIFNKGNICIDSSILYTEFGTLFSYNLITNEFGENINKLSDESFILYSGSLKVTKQRVFITEMVFDTKIKKIIFNKGLPKIMKKILLFNNPCYLPGVIFDHLSEDNCGNLLLAYSTNDNFLCNTVELRSRIYPNHYGIMSIDTNLVLQDTFDFSSGNTIINYKNPLNDSVVVIAGMKVFPDSTYQFVRFINIHRKCETSSHSRFIEQSDVFLYPTITKGELTLNKGEQAGQRFSIIFYSPDGRDCIRKNLEASDSFIDLSLLPDGIYLYTIMDINKQIINSGKIIKQQ